MLDSVKAVQAQQLYRVQAVTYDNGSNGKYQKNSEINFFNNGSHNLNYPVISGNSTVGKSLDLLA